METQFKIRNLRPADGKDLIRNYYGYYTELKENPTLGLLLFKKKPGLQSELKWFSSLMRGAKDGTKISSVAEMDGKVVGLCEVSIEKGKEQEHVGTLGIAIVEMARGRGIGEALMRDIIEKCKGKIEIIKLAVLSNNKGAKKLYRRVGFRKYGLLRDAVKRNGKYFDEDSHELGP